MNDGCRETLWKFLGEPLSADRIPFIRKFLTIIYTRAKAKFLSLSVSVHNFWRLGSLISLSFSLLFISVVYSLFGTSSCLWMTLYWAGMCSTTTTTRENKIPEGEDNATRRCCVDFAVQSRLSLASSRSFFFLLANVSRIFLSQYFERRLCVILFSLSFMTLPRLLWYFYEDFCYMENTELISVFLSRKRFITKFHQQRKTTQACSFSL